MRLALWLARGWIEAHRGLAAWGLDKPGGLRMGKVFRMPTCWWGRLWHQDVDGFGHAARFNARIYWR